MFRVLLVSFLILSASLVTTASGLEPTCERKGDLCVLSGVVRGVRLFEAGPSSRRFRLAAILSGDAAAAREVSITTDQGRTLALKPGQLTRRASLEVFAGEPGEKGVVTIGLKLSGDDGRPVCDGTAALALGQGKYDAAFVAGETKCDMIGLIQAFPTEAAGTWAIAFTAAGEGAAKITGGTLSTETTGKDGRPVVSTTPIEPSSFTTEREYLADVRFDGDPVGATYGFDVVVTESGRQLERARTSLDVIQLPGDGTPGLVFGIAGNGSGTKNASSQTSTRPQLL
jgi:hypothetical protein